MLALSSVPKPAAAAQTSTFYAGIFKVTQPGSVTQLALTEKLAPCKGRAAAAADRPKTRMLWGDGRGSFRTRGALSFSFATVRGTKWLVQDTCAGTLTRVTKGVVTVRDDVKHKTITVRAGKRYLAKARIFRARHRRGHVARDRGAAPSTVEHAAPVHATWSAQTPSLVRSAREPGPSGDSRSGRTAGASHG